MSVFLRRVILNVKYRLFTNKPYLNEMADDRLDEDVDLAALERRAAGNWYGSSILVRICVYGF